MLGGVDVLQPPCMMFMNNSIFEIFLRVLNVHASLEINKTKILNTQKQNLNGV